jgi:hypothetical protein
MDENFVVEKNRRVLPALGRIGIICGVAIAFILGLIGTVYLNLRSSEVQVPDVLGKNYIAGEEALGDAKLNIRKRASRYAPDTKPDTILDQSPRGGEMVKAGQTIAVVISRPPKEGESAPPPVDAATKKPDANRSTNEANDNAASKNQNNDKDQKQAKNARAKNVNSNDSANAKSNANANNRNANNRNRNSNNSNINNGNRNAANRNANNSNANNRNLNNRPTNSNGNRGINNLNTNTRAPVIPKPPLNPNGNTRTP